VTDRSDSFDRADSPSAIGSPSDGGGAYTVYTTATSFGIETNRAKATTGAIDIAALDASVSEGVAKVTAAVRGGNFRIVGRLSDNNNYIVGVIYNSGANGIMYKDVAGTFTQIGSTATGLSVTDGDSISLDIDASDNILFKVNTTTIISTTSTAGGTNTLWGFGTSGDTTTRFDDFSFTGAGGGGPALSLFRAVFSESLTPGMIVA